MKGMDNIDATLPGGRPADGGSDASFASPLVERFERDGYLIHDFGFSDALLDGCLEATKAIPNGYTRQQDLWRRSAHVKELAAHPDVLALLHDLYNRRPIPFQTLNFPVGTQQATHSDTYFFNSVPERFMCGVWIALEDIDADNGPLRYYPGSHKLPVYSSRDIAAASQGSHDMAAYRRFIDSKLKQGGYEKALGIVKRGQAIIWSANLFHGGEPIRQAGRSRYSQVNHYYFENCLYYTPIASNPETGRKSIREIYDISRGNFVQSRADGRKLYPSMRQFLGQRIHHMLGYCFKE